MRRGTHPAVCSRSLHQSFHHATGVLHQSDDLVVRHPLGPAPRSPRSRFRCDTPRSPGEFGEPGIAVLAADGDGEPSPVMIQNACRSTSRRSVRSSRWRIRPLEANSGWSASGWRRPAPGCSPRRKVEELFALGHENVERLAAPRGVGVAKPLGHAAADFPSASSGQPLVEHPGDVLHHFGDRRGDFHENGAPGRSEREHRQQPLAAHPHQPRAAPGPARPAWARWPRPALGQHPAPGPPGAESRRSGCGIREESRSPSLFVPGRGMGRISRFT